LQITGPQFRYLICLVCLSGLLPVAAPAQTSAPASAPASLSAAAQETVNKGILAAKQQDYLLAIRYFNDARKNAPDAPEIYFDLGLAESKIPGRELRAIAWFGAYLAANPSAPNAAAVRDQVDALDVRGQGNVSRVIRLVQDQATQKGTNPNSRDPNLILVARLWAEAGDIAAALKAADQVEYKNYKAEVQADITKIQARAGDVVGARETVNQVQFERYKVVAQIYIADALRSARNIADAQNVLSNALKTAHQSDLQTPGTLIRIARALLEVGDIEDARSTLAPALRAADKTLDENSSVDRDFRINAQISIAETQLLVGDITSAKIALAAALKTASQIDGSATTQADGAGKILALQTIGKLQARVADIAGALNTANQIQPAYWKSSVQTAVAEAQVKAGDIAGAKNTLAASLKTTSQKQPALGKSRALVQIARVLVKLGDIADARNTLEAALRAGDQSEYPYARVLARAIVTEASAEISAEVQIKAGDTTGAINTLVAALKAFDQTEDDSNKIVVQVHITEVLMKAGDITDAKGTLAAARKILDEKKIGTNDDKIRVRVDLAGALENLESTINPASAAPTTVTQTPVRPVTASDWLRRLDDTFVYGECPLNTDLFLDLAGYLKALPSSGDADKVFTALEHVSAGLNRGDSP
jgi:tetratricopeptide (TPR) repeat protein